MFPGRPEVTEKQPQVDKVGVDGPLGPALDGEHIKEEVFEELGALGVVDVQASQLILISEERRLYFNRYYFAK